MKFPSLSVKRRPVKKGAFRTYFANIVRSKRVRASTAAMPAMPEVDGDVPNLGIARALVVILIIHVVAIAGIFAHSHWVEEPSREEAARAAMAGIEPAKEPRDRGTPAPRVAESGPGYCAKEGETWASIAEDNGVGVEELRAANRDRTLKKGQILEIPPRVHVALVPDELKRTGNDSVVPDGPGPAEDKVRNAEMVDTTAVGSPELIKPRVPRPTTPPQAEPVSEAVHAPRTTAAAETKVKPAADETPAPARKYTVKQGDTFWKIAQAHKTTDKAIMKANGISDAKKLKPGMQLRIP